MNKPSEKKPDTIEELFLSAVLLLPMETLMHLIVCPACTERFISQFVSAFVPADDATTIRH